MTSEDKFVEFEADETANTDYSRIVSVPAGRTVPIAVNPIDASKFLQLRMSFRPWGSPPAGQDGDTISWSEKMRFIGARQEWLRVVEVTNSSQHDAEVVIYVRVQ